jgi:hypothetical protein
VHEAKLAAKKVIVELAKVREAIGRGDDVGQEPEAGSEPPETEETKSAGTSPEKSKEPDSNQGHDQEPTDKVGSEADVTANPGRVTVVKITGHSSSSALDKILDRFDQLMVKVDQLLERKAADDGTLLTLQSLDDLLSQAKEGYTMLTNLGESGGRGLHRQLTTLAVQLSATASLFSEGFADRLNVGAPTFGQDSSFLQQTIRTAYDASAARILTGESLRLLG